LLAWAPRNRFPAALGERAQVFDLFGAGKLRAESVPFGFDLVEPDSALVAF
jgi:hypothetical protein